MILQSTSGHIFKEKHSLKEYMHPNVHCSTVHSSQDMEVVSIDRRNIYRQRNR